MSTTQAASVESQEAGKREHSAIQCPYYSLSEAVKVAVAVHAVNGASCEVEQAAAKLGESPTSSSFRMKVAAAKQFGLITTGQGTITLTRLGAQVCDDQQEKAAKAEAFLTVPLFRSVYEQFKGAVLPPNNEGLEAALVSLGLAQKQKERARQMLQRSAQEAGYFWSGSQRLVAPPLKGSTAASAAAVEPEADEKEEKDPEPKERKPKPRHPLIEGLLMELPEPQSEWSTEDRRKWLEMVGGIFNVIYKGSDTSREAIRVVIEKTSAK